MNDIGQEYKYAGFWWRLLAYVIDALILNAFEVIVGFVIGLGLGANGYSDTDEVRATLTIFTLAAWWLYFALFESSPWKATLGKKAAGIVVVDLDGMQLSFARASGRHFAKYLSGLILGIGFLMAGWTSKKQALHDMVAGCLVLKRIAAREEAPIVAGEARRPQRVHLAG